MPGKGFWSAKLSHRKPAIRFGNARDIALFRNDRRTLSLHPGAVLDQRDDLHRRHRRIVPPDNLAIRIANLLVRIDVFPLIHYVADDRVTCYAVSRWPATARFRDHSGYPLTFYKPFVGAASQWAFCSALGNTLDDRIAQMVFVQALVEYRGSGRCVSL